MKEAVIPAFFARSRKLYPKSERRLRIFKPIEEFSGSMGIPPKKEFYVTEMDKDKDASRCNNG
jgi:endo-1,4-beta-D-glucanase Y